MSLLRLFPFAKRKRLRNHKEHKNENVGNVQIYSLGSRSSMRSVKVFEFFFVLLVFQQRRTLVFRSLRRLQHCQRFFLYIFIFFNVKKLRFLTPTLYSSTFSSRASVFPFQVGPKVPGLPVQMVSQNKADRETQAQKPFLIFKPDSLDI